LERKLKMIHFSFYVPITHAEKVKASIFEAGGGKIGNYDHCCFEIRGRGQFRPLEGNNAFVGQTNLVEYVEEVKIELVCEEDRLENVVKALKSSHPYETPAYYAIKTLNI
jgi:hypothetical protein